jgi:hypothetical protein
MVQINLGPAHDLGIRLRDMEQSIAKLSTRDVLQYASIGMGGPTVLGGGSISVKDGGSLNVQDGGTLNVSGAANFSGSLTLPSGALVAGGAITAATSIAAGTSLTAGTSLNGQSLALSGGTGAVTGVSSLSASGAVSAGSLASTGGVTAGGAVTGVSTLVASGAVSGTTGTFDSGLHSVDAFNFSITGTRVAGWTQNDGHLGTASSSARYKTNIVPAGIDPLAVLGIGIMHYNYKAEVARRDDPTSPAYVGPDYKVHLEVGAMAEDLHTAGLWEFVVYKRDLDGRLLLDIAGAPIAEGIHYEMFSLAVLAAAQHLNELVAAQGVEISSIQGRLIAAGL